MTRIECTVNNKYSLITHQQILPPLSSDVTQDSPYLTQLDVQK